MQTIDLDVAVVGAGTAGLYALARAASKTDNVLLFEGGPQGTTCARKGCMPSKAFIIAANQVHHLRRPQHPGIPEVPGFAVDTAALMARLREKRDYLAERTRTGSQDRFGEKIVPEYVRFVEPMVLEAESRRYRCGSIVLATGSVPVMPPGWRLEPGRIVTTDEFFELERLPDNALCVGMGPVGMELGQAMARMGIRTTAVEMTDRICGIQDPMVLKMYKKALVRDEVEYKLGTGAQLIGVGENGVRVRIEHLDSGETEEREFAMVLLSTGRRPNLDRLELENAGLELDDRGMPAFDKKTLKCGNQEVYLAGDATAIRPFYHDAADQGMLTGMNAASKEDGTLADTVPLTILFTEPQIAQVGTAFNQLDPENTLVGDSDPESSGRGVLQDAPRGLMRLYFDAGAGNRLLGAEMCADWGEHLAHTLAVIIHSRYGIDEMLRIPYYHPTFEEMIQSAALQAKKAGAKGRTLAVTG
ncbi:MAG: dihydrolipoyl dehydrogenase [Desulfatibacillaceae bacterium]